MFTPNEKDHKPNKSQQQLKQSIYETRKVTVDQSHHRPVSCALAQETGL